MDEASPVKVPVKVPPNLSVNSPVVITPSTHVPATSDPVACEQGGEVSAVQCGTACDGMAP